MAKLQVLFAALALTGFFIILESAPVEKKCRLVFTDVNKKELQQISNCTKALGYKGGREKSQKSACTMKCVLTNEKLLREDGQLSPEQFDIFLLEHFPPSLIARANETFTPCLALFNGKDINKEDEFCKPYDPLYKCLSRNFGNLCRGLPQALVFIRRHLKILNN